MSSSRAIRALLAALVFALFCSQGDAQLALTHAGGSSAPGLGYQGPGDIVAAADWYGLRAYSSAKLSGTVKAVNLRRASDNTTCDFDINTSGNLGGTDSGCGTGTGLSLAAFATQDATATCTIATTTATCTGASSTPHATSTITGAGITQPCFAVSVGTFTGGAGSVTVGGVGSSPCGTISSGETVTFTYGLFVTALYDQASTNGLSVGNSAEQPQLLPTCSMSKALPCMYFVQANNDFLADTFTAPSVPTTYNAVAAFITPSSFAAIMSASIVLNAARYGTELAEQTTDHIWAYNWVNNTVSTGSDAGLLTAGTWGVAGGVYASSTSRTGYKDSVAGTTDTSSSAVQTVTGLSLGNFKNSGSAGTDNFNGFIAEAGVWSSALNGTNMTALCHNDYLYWGTATSC